MKNEFGAVMDRNGYAPSIIGTDGRCYLCGRSGPLQRHEFIHGSNRDKAKKYGLWACLCQECHCRVHNGGAGLDWTLKAIAQRAAMKEYGWEVDDFRLIFGRNYLTEG